MPRLQRVSAWLPGCLLTVVLMACGGGGSGGNADGGHGSFHDAMGAEVSCDADLSAQNRRVYVDSRSPASDDCGASTGNACKTIQQGIDACRTAGCDVLVRHGLYPTTGTIALVAGVNVYGACRFNAEADRHYRTLVKANPRAGMPAIRAAGIDTKTLVQGLVVIGKTETAPGIASIAMLVDDSTGLVLKNTSLMAGRGGDGGQPPMTAAGAEGGAGGLPGGIAAGGAGGLACPSNPPPDVPNQPAVYPGRGGAGADSNVINTYHGPGYATCSNENRAVPGPFGFGGQASGTALGGTGSPPGTPGCYCDGFVDQAPGSSPQGGKGQEGPVAAVAPTLADIWGTLSGNGWSANHGDAGLTGHVGAGGGGGGGGGYSARSRTGGDAPDNHDRNGYAGAGGGGGGCGGTGGEGGQQGGASIVLVLAGKTAVDIAQQNRLIGGVGGAGSRGGLGGRGGAGGAGPPGRRGGDLTQYACPDILVPGSGGQGGTGGSGSAGSSGSGGNGGPAIAIARVRSATLPQPVAEMYAGQPGPGGSGNGGAFDLVGAVSADAQASPRVNGTDGKPGGGALTADFDASPGSVLLGGQRLLPMQGLWSPDGSHHLVLQSDSNLCLKTRADVYVWCTGTPSTSASSAEMQTDGNFVLYDGIYPLFNTVTEDHPGATLSLQQEGHVQVVGRDGNVLWSRP